MKERIIRVLEGINQRQLAEDIGVTPQAISKWKRTGYIDKENAFKLAALRGYNPEWLITGKGPQRMANSHAVNDPPANYDGGNLSSILSQLTESEIVQVALFARFILNQRRKPKESKYRQTKNPATGSG